MSTSSCTTIGLFIPPAYDTAVPLLGVAALSAFLKARGMKVHQHDLNLAFVCYAEEEGLPHMPGPEHRQAKVTKGVYYSDVLRHRGAFEDDSYWFERYPGSGFAFTERILSSRHLERYLTDAEENPYVEFFHRKVLPAIRQEGYDLVGFSITAPSQVVASFTFGRLIRQYFPGKKVVIGGQWVSLFREALSRRPAFRAFFDYMIYFEGETPLMRLVDALEGRKDLPQVPNLIYFSKGRWRFTGSRSEEEMDRLPCPDFDGLSLHAYTESGQGISLTYETSRGCYWNRCIYCVDLPLPRPRYREKSADLVVRDIKTLVEKYGATHLKISSPAFSPDQMRAVSGKLIEQNIDATWWAWARLDNGFDRETLRMAKEAGCTTLGFGLESINQRVLDFIDKGTEVAVMKRILEDAHEVGLRTYLQVLQGLPSESRDEAFDTLEFLMEAGDKISMEPAFNVYYLTPNNRIFLNPEKYGIRLKPGRRLPFRFFYPFDHVTGEVDVEKARKLLRVYVNMLERTCRVPSGLKDSSEPVCRHL